MMTQYELKKLFDDAFLKKKNYSRTLQSAQYVCESFTYMYVKRHILFYNVSMQKCKHHMEKYNLSCHGMKRLK